MGTTTLTQLSNRDRAVLRAIAEGRCVVSGECGHPLTIDGYCCADLFAKTRLTGAGLISVTDTAAWLTPTGQAVLTAA